MNKSLTFELLALIRAAKQGLAMADIQASIDQLERELATLRHDAPPADHSGQCAVCSAGDLCCENPEIH